ncbi:MAG: acyl-CoA dehydrogenase [Actinomyces sp.]|nr:MAG: acyl-CoA dehydrogenase [Actinomyces sp.]
MDLELSDDQRALQEAVDALCAGRFERAAVRAMIGAGLDRKRWRELAETGVFGLWVAPEGGGVGLGFADAAVVFEQLGRHLVPGPLAATTAAAELVDGALDGRAVVGTVERGPGAPDGVTVAHLGELDALVVVDDEGLWRLDPASLEARRAEHPLDPLTPVWWVTELPTGERVGDAADARLFRLRFRLLTAALELGVAVGATELAVAYARERHQFGRPIGAFQAVKHRCADMATRVEVLRAAVYAAGVALDDPETLDPDRAVGVAALMAARTAAACGRDCVQVHGGMGYTWEVDAHLYLKRAWVLDTDLGDLDAVAEGFAADLVASGAAGSPGHDDRRSTP